MGFFSVDLSPFLIKIWDATVGELKHLRQPKPRIEELKEAITELSAKEEDINNRIRLAELEREIPTKQVELWLGEVKDLKGKAAATEQDFESKRCLGGWSWNCFSVNQRVAKRMEEVDKLMTRSDASPVTTKKLPSAVVEIPISDSTFGMEAYKSKILGYITSPNAIEVIGIYGMGGAGKTTLLKSINNNTDIATKFDHVIWTVASKECKMEKLQKDIADRLELHLKQNDSADSRAAELYDFLKNKDCLLLLDDLWKPVNLEMLGMVNASSGHGEQKRKVVVFTTRYARVCGGMNTSREMQIKCLEAEEAWELFRSKASGPIGSDPGIEHIARRIAEECAGLPLALITVSAAMSRKNLWEEWSYALTLMKHSQIPQVTGENEKDPMFSVFKLSYDMLQDDEMRGCLLSCALWPEDHSINKGEIIECWLGLGLINEEGEIHKTFNKGYSHIETLKAACLLEPGNDEESEVKMHDVIRDMALWIASDCDEKTSKWIVRAGVGASVELEGNGWHEAARASLMYNDFATLPNQLSTCSKLSVLMLQYNKKLKKIRGTLIQAMRSLTYLDLSHTRIEDIPKEISMLSQLQHLNLSSTLIKELPAELGNLVNLKYLFLRWTSYLTAVAKGAISNLSLLRLLDLRGSALVHCSVCWDELEGLKGCPKSSIGIEITKAATLQRLYSLQHVSIWQLDLIGLDRVPYINICDDLAKLNQLMDGIMKHRNIRQSVEQLRIENAPSEQLLIIERNEEVGGLESLKFLSFSRLYTLEEIKWKGVLPQIVFPNLRELRIHCCALKNVNWVLQLPSLIVLGISFCKEMVELISDEGGSSPSCVSLRKMELFEMEKLTRISRRSLYFPKLEKIEVRDCPLLRKLPFFENRLKVIQCQQKWWDNLEWEDVRIKNSLWPHVVFGRNLVPLAVEQIPTSLSKVGIEECMGMILDHIASANDGVIGVHGMAGVGKTTLLHSIIEYGPPKFDHVILVVATKECKMERLQMDISKRLYWTIEEDDTEKDRSTKLFDIMEDKDCLLLLDDLSAPLDLTMLGIARATLRQGKQKRKVVVFTTRNKQVCSDMNASMTIEIKCLEPVQAWELFRSNIGEDTIESDAGIEHIAHKIAEEYIGVPLALNIIGKAMSTKKSSEEWNDALIQVKQLQMPEITSEKRAGPLFSASKISYDSLEDDDMRARLLSCALWPEDHSIEKDELIECWMGLGLMDVEGTIHEVYNRGHSHIEILKAAFLLEPGNYEEREVKMHDVIRDMALWVASDKFKWIVRVSQELEEERWHEAERVSLMYNIASLPNQLHTCSKLSMLMLQCNKTLKEIRGTLIQAMHSLTYLDLNNTEIIEIPKEIGMLSKLRYLNLNNTPITELPAELGLLKLKYLFLRNTSNLTAVAKGAISKLLLLRLLDLRGSRLVYCSVCWDELEGLKGCPKSSIRIDVGTLATLQGLCSLQHTLIWQLNVNFCDNSFSPNQLLVDIMKSCNTRQSVEQLKIGLSCWKELFISKGNEEAGGFEYLKYLQIFMFHYLEEITWKEVLPQIVFPNLQELTIRRCKKLQNMNWALQLPSLRVLKIGNCDAMEELISDEGILDSSSFGLRRMTLFSMRSLKRISRRPLCFPDLEEIVVLSCSLLNKLLFPMNKLKVIQCEQEWWDNLEWEDVSMKNSLSPFVYINRERQFRRTVFLPLHGGDRGEKLLAYQDCFY